MLPRIIRVDNKRFGEFFSLVCELADYEHLGRPSLEAKERLNVDITGEKPRIEAYIIENDEAAPVGYAIVLETYSSFLALPTMYLEDIFIREQFRGSGYGKAMFEFVLQLARERGCGRMDWQVLDWNMLARDFYEHQGAVPMKEWLLYRITI